MITITITIKQTAAGIDMGFASEKAGATVPELSARADLMDIFEGCGPLVASRAAGGGCSKLVTGPGSFINPMIKKLRDSEK